MLTKQENNVFKIAELVNSQAGKAITCFVLDGDLIVNVSCLPSKREEGAQ
jgi:hypothetical protein